MSPLRLALKDWRQLRQLTQVQLSQKSGVPQSTISRLEAGETGAVNLDHLERLARALETSVHSLIVEDRG